MEIISSCYDNIQNELLILYKSCFFLSKNRASVGQCCPIDGENESAENRRRELSNSNEIREGGAASFLNEAPVREINTGDNEPGNGQRAPCV